MPDDKGRDMVLQGDHLIKRDEIPNYFTTTIKHSLWLWEQYKRYGWPFGGGWIEQPWFVYEIINTCEMENGRRRKE